MVTKRLATAPLVIYIPDYAVRSITIKAEQPDVLHVVAEDISKSSLPEIWPKGKWGVEKPPAKVRAQFGYASWSDYISRPLRDEAFEDFVGVSKLDVGAFVRKYGLFKWQNSADLFNPAKDDEPRIKRFLVSEREYKSEQNYMSALLDLHGEIRIGNRGGARELAAKLPLAYADDPEKALSFAISERMGSQASLTLEKLNQAAVKCIDVITGLHAYHWGTFLTKHYWSTCPNCKVVFQANEKKIFHDIRCGRIYKQRRWRENRKKKNLQTSLKGKKRRISR